MKIFLSSKADRQLKKFPSAMYKLLLSHIEKLAVDAFPQRSKKLSGRNGWRIRVGDHRILYTVDVKREEITILSIAHRRDAYRLN